MAKIKLDENSLREDSKKLQSKIQELQDLKRRLDGLLLRIDASWNGDASDLYIVAMKNYANQTSQMVSVLSEFKKYVDRAVDRLEEADKEGAALLRNSFD